MPYASGILALELRGLVIREVTGSGWRLEVPNASEGFGAKGHDCWIPVTGGPECALSANFIHPNKFPCESFPCERKPSPVEDR